MSIDAGQLRALAIRALVDLDPRLASHEAVDLVLGTAAVESDLGTYLRQVGGGPALGICQMEPTTYRDIWESWLAHRPDLVRRLVELGHRRDPTVLEYDLRHAIVMCRLHYRRVPERLPALGDVEGMAWYWKRFYNTPRGAGTVDRFCAAWRKHLGGVS